MGYTLACTVIALLALTPAALAWRTLRRASRLNHYHVGYALVLGLCVSIACEFAKRWFWDLTGLSLSSADGGVVVALLAMLLFSAPLGEGSKLLVVWPLYTLRILANRASGVVLACSAGAGFASGGVLALLSQPDADGASEHYRPATGL